MIKISGAKTTAVQAAKYIMLDGAFITREAIARYIDADLTDKELEEIFEWLEKYRQELAAKWGFDVVPRD